MPAIAGTRFNSELQVRPDDIDMNQHVHASKYFDYVLAARYDQMARCYKMGMDEFVAQKLMAKLKLKKSDIDLWELNEAFAAVVLRWVQAFDLDMDKVNVNGGAIAMGHPIGATGAMILGTMVDELERADKERALVTLCIGAGMGTATVIERVN
jgi:acetyl-CoA acetyltransferase